MSLQTLPLAEIAAKIDYGLTASANEAPVGPRFLRITDIQEDAVNWNDVPFCEGTPKKLAKARIEPGDIVFARTGATTGKSFLINDPPENAVFASYLIRVRPSDKAIPSYLAHFFRSQEYWSQIKNRTRGAAQGGVNATSLGELEVPLPPLGEQRRIAGILDAADALRRRRREALALLDTLPGAIFGEMFGNCDETSLLGDISDSIDYGLTASAKEERVGPRFLRITDIQDNSVDWSVVPYCSADPKKIAKSRLSIGDIVFARTGATTGKSFIISELPEDAVFASYLIRVRPTDKLDPVWLYQFFQSRKYWSYVNAQTRGAAQGGMNATVLKAMPIPIFKIGDQRKFASIWSEIHCRKQIMTQNLRELETLFASLQSRAFAGAL